VVDISRIKAPARRPKTAAASFISNISITNLFGRITYNEVELNHISSEKNINIIYGDNGSGKTTIFNLIYSTISPESNAGLRSYLAKTQFEKFQIVFDDKKIISIEKEKGLTGSYDFSISQRGKNLLKARVKPDEDGEVRSQKSVHEIEIELSKIGLDVLFVDHQRKVKSTYHFLEEVSENEYIQYSDSLHRTIIQQGRMNSRISNLFPIIGMVEAVNDRFRSEAFQQGNVGEIDASNVYLEIARALNRPPKQDHVDEHKRPLDEVLDDLAARAASYVRHGLLPEYPFSDIKAAFTGATKSKKITISAALQPFVTSIERRIRALSSLHSLMKTFEDELNLYFSDKIASVHVLDGIALSNGKYDIPLDSLSSGEKQLIFFLCSAIVAQKHQSLILIDEPELSLNYKWQRNTRLSP